jgi:hypothetical protein
MLFSGFAPNHLAGCNGSQISWFESGPVRCLSAEDCRARAAAAIPRHSALARSPVAGPCYYSCGILAVRTMKMKFPVIALIATSFFVGVASAASRTEPAAYPRCYSVREMAFLRKADGTVAKWDLRFGRSKTCLTVAQAINVQGVVGGCVRNGYVKDGGFLRMPDGSVTVFTVKKHSTDVSGINGSGAVTGGSPIFVRNPDGTMKIIHLGEYGGGRSINSKDDIAGTYYDGQLYRGFVALAKGKISEFDGAKGALGTQAVDINDLKQVVGFYDDAGKVWHGFLRTPDGVLTTFDDPDGQGTFPAAINGANAIAGFYVDGNYAYHGFLRAPDGSFTNIDVPGSSQTVPTCMNGSGQIAGYFSDTAGTHGFIRNPDGTYTTVEQIW